MAGSAARPTPPARPLGRPAPCPAPCPAPLRALRLGRPAPCSAGSAAPCAARPPQPDPPRAPAWPPSGCSALSIVKQGDLMVVANVGDSWVVLGTAFDDDAITSSSSSSTSSPTCHVSRY
uniref:protein-serine/threonine phosphatase n=1 Tax=Zea mays TaxID=4577 RepID=A0A804RG70_MAIZE